MGDKTMNTRVQNKHDLEVNWQKAINFKPLAGELIVYDAERDDDPIPEGREYSIARPRFKVGDGENFVNDLDFTDLVYQFNGLSDEEQDKARDNLGLAPLIATLTWDDEAKEWTCSVSLNEMLDALNAGISVRVVVNDWDYFIPISYTEYAIIFGSFSDDGFYSVIWIGEDYIYYGADIALVRYDDNGCLSSNEPVGRDNVATKGYVDSIAELQVGKQDSNGAEGAEIFNDYENNKATGLYSHAEGLNTGAIGEASHTEGYKTSTGFKGYSEVYYASLYDPNNPLLVIGSTEPAKYYSIGDNLQIGLVDGSILMDKFKINEIYEISYNSDVPDATQIGLSKLTDEDITISQSDIEYIAVYNKPYGDIVTEGAHAHAEGYNTLAIGENAHAEGNSTQALGEASHSEGKDTHATGNNSHAEGVETYAAGEAAHAEGLNTKATAQGSHAEGKSTIAASPYQHVEGRYNVQDTDGIYAHILGGGAEYSTGRACTVYDIRGKNCNIFYSYAGKTAGEANGVNFIVYGAQGTLNNFQQLAESGFIHQQTDTVEMKVDISNMDFLKLEIIVESANASCGSAWANALIGKCYNAYYGCSRATSLSNDIPYKVYDVIYLSDLPFTISDYPGNAQYPVRHACADCQWYTIDNPVKIALKDSKGNSQTFDKGLGVHPYALNTKPTTKTVLQNAYKVDWAGNAAFAGNITSAGKTVLTQQENGGTTSNSQLNVAGDDAHAEGFLTQALGFGSHAEGCGSDNDGSYWTIASGTGSHAEGVTTRASGKGSHAEGETTNAVGNFSHAEGLMTAALGRSSHAEGFLTRACGEGQHVQGILNMPDVFDNQGQMYDENGNITDDIEQAVFQNNYAHIVGNGDISKSQWSNAHTLDWNGNAWFAGKVKVGGTGQFDSEAKTLLTAEDLPISNKKWITLLDNYSFTTDEIIIPFTLQPNQKYRVTFDGIDFYCSTQLYPNDPTMFILGNAFLADTTEGVNTGEPFVIVSMQNLSLLFFEDSQCTISIAILQDMINPSHIADMYHTEIGEAHLATYILKDSISFLPDMNVSFGTLTMPLNLQPGEEYVVNWLGRYYWCVAKRHEDDNNEIYIGNGGVVGGIDSGEPFLFIEDQSEVTVVQRGENKVGVMPIQIFKAGTIHPVPEKYLPESVATKDYVNSMVGNGGGTAIKLHIWEEND